MKILSAENAGKAVKMLRKKIEGSGDHVLRVLTRSSVKDKNGKFVDILIPFNHNKRGGGTCIGITVAVIKDKNDEQLGIGRAYCSIDDIWNKKVGQYIAVYRAYKDAFDELYNESERENVLNFERYKREDLRWIIGADNNENRNTKNRNDGNV